MNTQLELQNKDFYKFWATEIVRYGDLDPVGHANNAAYSTYFETARVDLLSAMKSQYMDLYNTAIVQLNINFLKELKLGDTLDIGITIGKIGNSSLELYSAIFVKDECRATSYGVTVNFDTVKRKSAPIPSEIKELLIPYQKAS